MISDVPIIMSYGMQILLSKQSVMINDMEALLHKTWASTSVGKHLNLGYSQ